MSPSSSTAAHDSTVSCSRPSTPSRHRSRPPSRGIPMAPSSTHSTPLTRPIRARDSSVLDPTMHAHVAERTARLPDRVAKTFLLGHSGTATTSAEPESRTRSGLAQLRRRRCGGVLSGDGRDVRVPISSDRTVKRCRLPRAAGKIAETAERSADRGSRAARHGAPLAARPLEARRPRLRDDADRIDDPAAVGLDPRCKPCRASTQGLRCAEEPS